MPVVMVSTLTQEGAPTTLEALELGAVDFVAKPTKNVTRELQAYAEILHDKVRAASQARVRAYNPPHTSSHANKVNTPDAIEFNQKCLNCNWCLHRRDRGDKRSAYSFTCAFSSCCYYATYSSSFLAHHLLNVWIEFQK